MKTPNQNRIVFEMSSGPALQISHLPEDQEIQVSAFPNEVCLTISVSDHIFALSELKPEQAKELVKLLNIAIEEAEQKD